MIKPHTQITHQGNVEKLAFGGEGIVRQDGLVVFLPFTAPGDQVCYSITKQKKNYAEGKLEKVISPSPDRIEPKCPYFGTCGGCQLQHIDYPKQAEIKQQWVKEALERGCRTNLDIEIVSTDLIWSYRRKISLVIKPKGDHFEAGYISCDQKTLVVINQCPIFTSNKDPILERLQEICQKLSSRGCEEGKCTILKDHEGKYLLHFHFKNLPKNMQEVLNEVSESAIASSPKKSITKGNFQTSIEIEELRFSFSSTSFVQNHPNQSLKIYQKIVKIAERIEATSVLDLYCGVGILSLLLAKKGCSVTGIELNRAAVKDAKENAKTNRMTSLQFIEGDVAKIAESHLKENPSLVIVNPPREGLSQEVIKLLLKYPPKHFIYVSCMPSTLARDLQLLKSGGLKVNKATAFDMFPQTTHVETLVDGLFSQ